MVCPCRLVGSLGRIFSESEQWQGSHYKMLKNAEAKDRANRKDQLEPRKRGVAQAPGHAEAGTGGGRVPWGRGPGERKGRSTGYLPVRWWEDSGR